MRSTRGDIMEMEELIRCSLVVTWYFGYITDVVSYLRLTVMANEEISSLINDDMLWSKNFNKSYSDFSNLSPREFYFSITGVDFLVGEHKIPTKKMVDELVKTAKLGLIILDRDRFIRLIAERGDYKIEEISTVVDLDLFLGKCDPGNKRLKFLHDLIRSAEDINKKI